MSAQQQIVSETHHPLVVTGLSAVGRPGGAAPVREISLTVTAGTTLVLLGGPDDGTATLLDAIAGHNPVGAGTIRCLGTRIDRLEPAERPVVIVSERDPLFGHLDVAGNIGFPLRASGLSSAERNRRVADTLALVGLDALARARPTSLGAVDRVRAAIARALAFDPAVLLVDEPFATLRSRERAGLCGALRRLARARGLTMLVATEDREDALLLGDQIGVLHRGSLHQIGTGPDLLERPADAVVASRIGDANLLPGRIVAIDEDCAEVRLKSGHVMEAEPVGVLRPDDACMLAVRPDRIATAFLSRSGTEPQAGSLPAVLQDAVHLGDHLRLRFRLSDGSEILVRRPPAASIGELKAGRMAMLAWQPHQARVFTVTD